MTFPIQKFWWCYERPQMNVALVTRSGQSLIQMEKEDAAKSSKCKCFYKPGEIWIISSHEIKALQGC